MAANIVEVIAELDMIVDETRSRRDPLAYFAAMYRAVTRRIKSDIDAGLFDDGPRMDQVDTTFANYYLRAYAAHRSGATVAAPWAMAFDFAARSKAGVFQHLLLGMNAHINYDLGQAVVDDASIALPDLKGDYDRINDILFSLLGPLQDAIEVHLFGATFVDCLLGRLDESFAGWEMAKARAHAWEHAVELDDATSAAERAAVVKHMDRFTTDLARRLLVPNRPPASAAWWLARRVERTDVAAIVASIESVG